MTLCCRCPSEAEHKLHNLDFHWSGEEQWAPTKHWSAEHSEAIFDSASEKNGTAHEQVANVAGSTQTPKAKTPKARSCLHVSKSSKPVCFAKVEVKPQQHSQQICDVCLSFCQFFCSGDKRPSTRKSSQSCSRKLSLEPNEVLPTTPGKCDKELLRDAARTGRYVDAYSELLKLEAEGGNPSEVLEEPAIERVRRIGHKYIEAIRIFGLSISDFSTNEYYEDLKLGWGFQIEENMAQLMSTADVDCDFIKVIACDQNLDLEDLISKDDVQAYVLGEVHVHDATWRKKIVSKSFGSKSDDILIVSTIDALDEPIGSICQLEYSPDSSDTRTPSGVPIPPVEESYARCPYVFGVKRNQPLRELDGSVHGVRRTEFAEIELPSIIAKLVRMMPSFLVRMTVRGFARQGANAARKLWGTSTELTKRVGQQPRADFYEHVQRHLCQRKSLTR